MGLAPSTDGSCTDCGDSTSPSLELTQQIGEVYNNVKVIAENIESLENIAGNLAELLEVDAQADSAAASALAAAASATVSDAAKVSALASANDADADRIAAQAAKTAAETAQGLADTAKTAAQTAKTAAETARDASIAAKTAAEAARDTLALPTGAANVGFRATGSTKDMTIDEVLKDGIIYVSRFHGADDVERIVNALTFAPEGSTVKFTEGGTSAINRLITIGSSGGAADIAVAKNLKIDARGHTFNFTANDARFEFNGPISPILTLNTNYVKGSRTLIVNHAGNLAEFQRGRWLRIVSNSLDPWNRNQGTQANQYRLAEWAQIKKVTDNGGGTATIKLVNPLKFVRGLTNTGDAENLTEGDTYTTANNTRVFTLIKDDFTWNGGNFMITNPDAKIGAAGWTTRSYLMVRGFGRPTILDPNILPGVGKGIEIMGCPEFEINNPRINKLPDFAELAANVDTTGWPQYLGYGIAVSGCWGGVIDSMRAKDTRHAITESNSTSVVDSASYGILLSIGRTYGTRIDNAHAGGQFSAAIDTHHGADSWIITNAVITGTESGCGISLRGPGHSVSNCHITAERGIQVFSEWDNDGLPDLPALNGNANKYMSSARLNNVHIDCTLEAVNASAAYVTMEGGARIRCRSHSVFAAPAGVLDFSSGRFSVEVTGEAQAATISGDTMQRGIFHTNDVSVQYGATWFPGFIIREGANLEIDATAAVDSQTMYVFNQAIVTGVAQTTGQIDLKGGLKMILPAAGMSGNVFGSSLYWTIERSATFDLTGNAAIVTAFPKWEKGRVRIANLAAGTAGAQRLFSFKDGLGGLSSFVAMLKLYAVDQGSGALVAEYQIQDSYAVDSAVENTFVLTNNATADFEANSNIDLTTTATTAGKIGLSLLNGGLFVAHNKAGVVYEDVWADITIVRQSRKS